MKKLLLLVVASMFLFGCASLKDPEYRKHNTIYASSSHMECQGAGAIRQRRMVGYRNPIYPCQVIFLTASSI
jgi:hypothetical protein